MTTPADPAITGLTGGPAGGTPAVNPTAPVAPSSQTSGAGTDPRQANSGYQSYVDQTLASLGYNSLRVVPDARSVQQLAAAAQQAQALQQELAAKQAAEARLEAAKTSAEQAAAREAFKNRKILALAKVNPGLISMADSIVVPEGSDEAAILQAANGFLEGLKAMGFVPAGTTIQAPAAAPAQLPAAPNLAAGAPPAGQLTTIDDEIRAAQADMWDKATGKDPKAFKEAEDKYFAALNRKVREQGWVDTKWGRPPGLD